MKQEKQCPICNELFKPSHGNDKFCGDDCYEINKGKKQRQNNLLLQAFRDGFLQNYKRFTKLLPDAGHLILPIVKMLKGGLDQDAFYGTFIDKNQYRWYKVNEYMFSIVEKDKELFFHLYKK